MPDWVAALLALTGMEIVLGIDNIIFLAVIAGKLPEEQQPKARRLGLIIALVTRLLLLFSLKWLIDSGQKALFTLPSLGLPIAEGTLAFTLSEIIMLVGGLFLIGKSVFEIHEKLEGEEADEKQGGTGVTFTSVLVQIAVIDVVFSIDSVITAVGMARDLWVMATAMTVAVGVMLAFAEPISEFVHRHPTLKMLALSFLILIGVLLVGEGLGQHFNKNYIYFAMAFSLVVELLNLRLRKGKRDPVPLKQTRLPEKRRGG